MDTRFIVGNWKSNKTIDEAKQWLETFKIQTIPSENISIILCVPFTLLSICKDFVTANKIPVKLGVQDISPYSIGSYTGEIAASMVKGLADYVMIGHSERRKYFKETDEMLFLKTKEAKQEGLSVIYCVEDDFVAVPQGGVDLILYEPPTAIGTGTAQSGEEANKMAQKIFEKVGKPVLYGGSVNATNVKDFTGKPYIKGVGIGKASLQVSDFVALISAVSS